MTLWTSPRRTPTSDGSSTCWPSATTFLPAAWAKNPTAACASRPASRTDVSPQLRRGTLVTLEGGEGSGKSTQAETLAGLLRERGYSVVLTREPAGTRLGGIVKEILHQGVALTPEAEMFLFQAARAQHVQEVVRP